VCESHTLTRAIFVRYRNCQVANEDAGPRLHWAGVLMVPLQVGKPVV